MSYVLSSATADALNITTSGTAVNPIIYQFNGATFERFAVLANNLVVDDIRAICRASSRPR
jgi:hypothetical protein